MSSLSSKQRAQLVWMLAALAVGILFRQLWLLDMEYKFDEEWMFQKALVMGRTEPWSWLGMPSGANAIQNPGLSVWIFVALARLTGAETPLALGEAVVFCNCLALVGLALFAFRRVPQEEREPWLWAVALVAVNPFAVLYERKIWAQSMLPLFCVALLWGWWERRRLIGAFVWGLVGALVGQVHMSGFFFAAALALWTALFARSTARWVAWFAGSFLGALPLIPWLRYLLTGATSLGEKRRLTANFFEYWITDPLGIHLGHAVGAHRGPGALRQLSDFFQYPVVGGTPTYGVAIAYLVIVLIAAVLLGRALITLVRSLQTGRANLRSLLTGSNDSDLLVRAAFIGFGLLLTLTMLPMQRHYLLITYPLEFVWLTTLALRPGGKLGRPLLGGLIAAQLLLTATFLGYIHLHGGASEGDYGRSLRTHVAPTSKSISDQ